MKKSYCKRVMAAVLSAAIVFSMMPLTGMQVYADTAENTQTVKLAILSDIHYVSEDNRMRAAGEDFRNAEKAENRMMSEIGAILNQALKDATEAKPDAMLVCGDLCSNGEASNEEELADTLRSAEGGLDGAKIYVVNGNHDINNSYGADFTGSDVKAAQRTTSARFKRIYKWLGYGTADGTRFYKANPGEEVRNYGGLSYATEIQDGITLIALDTAQYSADTGAGFSEAQTTAGSVSDGLLAWAAKEASDAKKKGNLVLAMCHHSIIPHQGIKNETSDLFFSEYLVPDWEHVAGTLADAGVSAIMTGHSHANDISQYTSKSGNTIYDIQTAALCAYPCAWRTLNITIDKSDGEKKYSFDIDTHFIDEVYGIGELKDGGLQEYSYVKTGLPEEALPNIAGFFIREQLYAIKNHVDGFNGFLKERLEVPGKYESIGEYGVDEISDLIDGMKPVTEEFSLLGSDYTLKLSLDKKASEKTVKVFDISLSYKTSREDEEVELNNDDYLKIKGKLDELAKDDNYKNTFTVTQDESSKKWTIKMEKGFPEATKAEICILAGKPVSDEVVEAGRLTADLSGLAEGIDAAAGKADKYIQGKEGDWDNNYKRTEIEKEAGILVEKKAREAFTTPITEDDDQTKPLFIARDALQAFARGDEDSFVQEEIYTNTSASDLKEKRENWNRLIRSEAFENNLKQTLVDSASELISDDKDYPACYDILNTYMGPEKIDRSAPEDAENLAPIFTFKAEGGTEASTLNALCSSMLGQIKTPKDVIAVAGLLNQLGVHPLSAVSFEKLTNMFAELQASLTTDTNIRSDSKWSFHTVSLDTKGGSVSASAITTVEDNKAGALPTPARKGYVFQGWFTEADGGEIVTSDTDLKDITKLYAQWQSAPSPAPARAAKASVNARTVNSALVRRAVQAAGGNVDTLVLGKKVKKISRKAFAGTGIKTLVVTSKKLKKRSVKGSLKSSGVTTVRVNVGKAKTNKKYAKRYKKFFTKKNAGKKVKVKKY